MACAKPFARNSFSCSIQPYNSRTRKNPIILEILEILDTHRFTIIQSIILDTHRFHQNPGHPLYVFLVFGIFVGLA